MPSLPASVGKQPTGVRTQIDFCVKSDHLCLADVSKALGLPPTYGCERGARYIGKEKIGDEIRAIERQRPFGT